MVTQVTTKDGECKISIELTININQSGEVVATAKQIEETAWAIPDFSSKEKIKFGKKEGIILYFNQNIFFYSKKSYSYHKRPKCSK